MSVRKLCSKSIKSCIKETFKHFTVCFWAQVQWNCKNRADDWLGICWLVLCWNHSKTIFLSLPKGNKNHAVYTWFMFSESSKNSTTHCLNPRMAYQEPKKHFQNSLMDYTFANEDEELQAPLYPVYFYSSAFTRVSFFRSRTEMCSKINIML